MNKESLANVVPVRQRTQYTCMATSLSMCFKALGYDLNEDQVNKVLKAAPMQGASWEGAIAAAQHFGCRATFVSPCTPNMLREATNKGNPIIISWSPEGNPWPHASVVVNVNATHVFVADPNIPDPSQTTREVPIGKFCSQWVEHLSGYNFRRPALIISQEIDSQGRQVMASKTFTEAWGPTLAERSPSPYLKFASQWEELNKNETSPELATKSGKLSIVNKDETSGTVTGASKLPGEGQAESKEDEGFDPGEKTEEGYDPGKVKEACEKSREEVLKVAMSLAVGMHAVPQHKCMDFLKVHADRERCLAAKMLMACDSAVNSLSEEVYKGVLAGSNASRYPKTASKLYGMESDMPKHAVECVIQAATQMGDELVKKVGSSGRDYLEANLEANLSYALLHTYLPA